MKDDFFKNIPLDNSMSTQARYDIFASKMATGFNNNNRKMSYNSNNDTIGLLVAIVQLLSSIVFFVFAGLSWILNKVFK
mgnify:CR=1 FL=1|jgi:hypothetical protein